MESLKKRILIADDHGVVRKGIRNSLADNFSNAEFGEAENASELMHLINESMWDLVVLDISMPGRNGLDILKDIKCKHPELPVIILSMFPEDQFAVRAIKAGASTYLTKNIPVKEFCEAIRRILNGERYLTNPVMELVANELRDDHSKSDLDTLSDREYQVFLFIASGKNVTSIANELSLSVKTISVYRSNILRKMKLKNNAEITYYAFQNNLVK